MQRVCVGRPHTTHMITLHTDAEAEASQHMSCCQSLSAQRSCLPADTDTRNYRCLKASELATMVER
jgi:hypothetical protein